MPKARSKKSKRSPTTRVSYETVCRIGLALPGVEESTSYGTPSLKVAGKFLCRLKEDGDTLALRIGFEQREMLMETEPKTFFITDHYLNYPAILVRLPRIGAAKLAAILEEAWRFSAPARLQAARRTLSAKK